MGTDQQELLACHQCDRIHRMEPLPAGGEALCGRCGASLYRFLPDSLSRTTALCLAALLLLVLANTQPFLTLQSTGHDQQSMLLAAAWALYQHDMAILSLLIVLTSLLAPAVVICSMLYLLLPLHFGHRPAAAGSVYRLIDRLSSWSLLGVFMLAVVIAIIKLLPMAQIVPGTALYALLALMVVYSAARSGFEPHAFWSRMPRPLADPARVAAGEATLSCPSCHLLLLQRDIQDHCPCCGGRLRQRIANSTEQSAALLFSASILFIPANTLPVMTVSQPGSVESATILGGILQLMSLGMYGIALVIFFVSIVVPVAKLASLFYLLYSVRTGSAWRPRDRTRLYRVTERIGSWSMVDVFIVGLLTALVSMGLVAGIAPGPGILFFAAVVVITMFAAARFDPRLIWDRMAEGRNG